MFLRSTQLREAHASQASGARAYGDDRHEAEDAPALVERCTDDGRLRYLPTGGIKEWPRVIGKRRGGGEAPKVAFAARASSWGATTTTAQEQVRERRLDRQRGSERPVHPSSERIPLTAAGLQWLRRASVVAETATQDTQPARVSPSLDPTLSAAC
ncbi:hypothetical protein MTO96_001958 [Rhipicephalus appendiculatus]